MKSACVALIFCPLLALSAAEPDDDVSIVARQASRPDWSRYKARLLGPKAAEVEAAAAELLELNNHDAFKMLWEAYALAQAATRLTIVRTAGKLARPDDAEAFFKIALGDLSQTVRLCAAEQLALLETPEKACARLSHAAADIQKLSPLLRLRALQALARIGGASAGHKLKAFLDSKEIELAVAAAEGLGNLGNSSFAKALLQTLDSANPELKPAAADALETLTGQKFRFDVVKWQQWLKAQQTQRPERIDSPSENLEFTSYGSLPTKPPSESAVDLVVVFDTTGSLVHIWPQMSFVVDSVVEQLIKRTPSLRIGTVKYRGLDGRNKYSVQTKPLTRAHQLMREDIQDASFGGSSGALYAALLQAVCGMPWRANARKMILIVGDQSPEGDGLADAMRLIRDLSELDGVLFNSIYVRSAHGEEQLMAYKQLTLAGHGRFYEYNKAEKHLVELSVDKPDVKKVELSAEIAIKMLTPRR